MVEIKKSSDILKRTVEAISSAPIFSVINLVRNNIRKLRKRGIEFATQEDFEVVRNIFDICKKDFKEKGISHWEEAYTQEHLEYNFETKKILILYHKGKPIGTISMEQIEQNINISGLAILPEYQGKGYGKQLLEYAEQYAKNQGFQKATLDIVVYHDGRYDRLLQFYERKGYQIGEPKKISGEEFDVWFLEKNLET